MSADGFPSGWYGDSMVEPANATDQLEDTIVKETVKSQKKTILVKRPLRMYAITNYSLSPERRANFNARRREEP